MRSMEGSRIIELREKTLPDTARYAFSLVNSLRIILYISSYGKVLRAPEMSTKCGSGANYGTVCKNTRATFFNLLCSLAHKSHYLTAR